MVPAIRAAAFKCSLREPDFSLLDALMPVSVNPNVCVRNTIRARIAGAGLTCHDSGIAVGQTNTCNYLPMPLPESPIKLHGRDNCDNFLVYAHKDLATFFDKKLVLDHGWRSRIIPELFRKFVEACQSELTPSYDPENPEKVAEILSRMNFNLPQTHGKPKRKSSTP